MSDTNGFLTGDEFTMSNTMYSEVGTPEQITGLWCKLFKLKQALGPLVNDAVGQHRAARFKYATLEQIHALIDPALAGAGLWVATPIVGVVGSPQNAVMVIFGDDVCRVHVTYRIPGDCSTEVGDLDAGKVYGGMVTYSRRYALSAFFGLVGEDADDMSKPEARQSAPGDRPAARPQAQAARQAPAAPAQPQRPNLAGDSLSPAKKDVIKGLLNQVQATREEWAMVQQLVGLVPTTLDALHWKSFEPVAAKLREILGEGVSITDYCKGAGGSQASETDDMYS